MDKPKLNVKSGFFKQNYFNCSSWISALHWLEKCYEKLEYRGNMKVLLGIKMKKKCVFDSELVCIKFVWILLSYTEYCWDLQSLYISNFTLHRKLKNKVRVNTFTQYFRHNTSFCKIGRKKLSLPIILSSEYFSYRERNFGKL